MTALPIAMDVEAARNSAVVRNIPSHRRAPYDLRRSLVYEDHVQIFVGQIPNGKVDVRTAVAALIRNITSIPIYFDGVGGSNNSMFLWVPTVHADALLKWSRALSMRKLTVDGRKRVEAVVLDVGQEAPEGFGHLMPFELAKSTAEVPAYP
jgi:hypothetical protein